MKPWAKRAIPHLGEGQHFAIEVVRTYPDREFWNAAVLRDGILSPGCRLVAVALSAHLNFKTGQLNPSVQRLAEHTSQSEQGTLNHLNHLVSRGWVVKRSTRGRTSNHYQLQLITPNDGVGLNPQQGLGVEGGNPPYPISNPQMPLHQPPRAVGSNLRNSLNTARLAKDHYRSGVTSLQDPSAQVPGIGKYGVVLANLLGQRKFIDWFKGAELLPGSPFTILVPKRFQKNWIVEKFSRELETVFGTDFIVMASETLAEDTQESARRALIRY